MLRVGMHFVTLCVTSLRRAAQSRADAERPELHSHAEREERDSILAPMLHAGRHTLRYSVCRYGNALRASSA